MKKSRRTKHALLLSLLSMLVCMAMLAGSTFAWFTDSVSTGLNKIVAGNLDVKLYTKEGESYVPVSSEKALFNENVLWEPGHTEVVYLKVENGGTLALNYKFAIDVVSEQPGENGDKNPIKLSDYLVFGQTTEESEKTYTTREEAWKAVGEPKKLTSFSGEQKLLPNESKYIALVVYMPTSVGNEANYHNGKKPSIELSITLVATQAAEEADSFDNQYDQYAPYPDATPVANVEQFSSAIKDAKDGDVIALTNDMVLTDSLTIGKAVTINGNGNEISGKPITVTADVTFENLSLVKPVNTGNNASLFYAGAGCENIVFDGCTFSDPQWEAVQVTSDDLKSLTITNCVFTAAEVKGAANSGYGNTANQAIRYIHVQPSNNPVVEITITNNTFKDCENVVDSVVGVYFVSTESTITVGGNTFEGWGDRDVTDGRSAKLSVGWPEVEELKTVAVWKGNLQTFRIDKSNPTIN